MGLKNEGPWPPDGVIHIYKLGLICINEPHMHPLKLHFLCQFNFLNIKLFLKGVNFGTLWVSLVVQLHLKKFLIVFTRF